MFRRCQERPLPLHAESHQHVQTHAHACFGISGTRDNYIIELIESIELSQLGLCKIYKRDNFLFAFAVYSISGDAVHERYIRTDYVLQYSRVILYHDLRGWDIVATLQKTRYGTADQGNVSDRAKSLHFYMHFHILRAYFIIVVNQIIRAKYSGATVDTYSIRSTVHFSGSRTMLREAVRSWHWYFDYRVRYTRIFRRCRLEK